jgi:hypothetical protein
MQQSQLRSVHPNAKLRTAVRTHYLLAAVLEGAGIGNASPVDPPPPCPVRFAARQTGEPGEMIQAHGWFELKRTFRNEYTPELVLGGFDLTLSLQCQHHAHQPLLPNLRQDVAKWQLL